MSQTKQFIIAEFDKKFGRLVMAQNTDEFNENPYGARDIKKHLISKLIEQLEELEKEVKKIDGLEYIQATDALENVSDLIQERLQALR